MSGYKDTKPECIYFRPERRRNNGSRAHTWMWVTGGYTGESRLRHVDSSYPGFVPVCAPHVGVLRTSLMTHGDDVNERRRTTPCAHSVFAFISRHRRSLLTLPTTFCVVATVEQFAVRWRIVSLSSSLSHNPPGISHLSTRQRQSPPLAHLAPRHHRGLRYHQLHHNIS